MPLTDAQQKTISDARARSAQDKKVPLLIHMDDGRLLPNTKQTRKNPKYRPYTGNPKAGLKERLAFVATLSTGHGQRAIVDSSEDVFDLGKASKEDLIDFAATELQLTLDPSMTVRNMRTAITEAHALRSVPLPPAGDDLSE